MMVTIIVTMNAHMMMTIVGAADARTIEMQMITTIAEGGWNFLPASAASSAIASYKTAPTSRRGWPKRTVCLQVWNDSYNAMVLCHRDCKNAFNLCPVSAQYVYPGCGRTGCGLCWVAELFCLIQLSASLICSGSTPADRRGLSVSVPAKQTLRRDIS